MDHVGVTNVAFLCTTTGILTLLQIWQSDLHGSTSTRKDVKIILYLLFGRKTILNSLFELSHCLQDENLKRTKNPAHVLRL